MTPEESPIIAYANLLVDISKKLKSNPSPERKGGVLMRALNNFSKTGLYHIGGELTNDKIVKYLSFAQEKAHRLYSNWLRDPESFFSSFQDKDEDKRKYAGAVLFCKGNPSCNIFSFSGLAQLTDEAVSLMIGKIFKYGSEDECKRIADFSENQVFYEMLKKLKGMKNL